MRLSKVQFGTKYHNNRQGSANYRLPNFRFLLTEADHLPCWSVVSASLCFWRNYIMTKRTKKPVKKFHTAHDSGILITEENSKKN